MYSRYWHSILYHGSNTLSCVQESSRAMPKRKQDVQTMSAAWHETRRSSKMAEKLARQIVEDMTIADRQPGEMLPAEAEMIQSYGVGRATLREALRVVEMLGLITVKSGPKGGPVVKELSGADFARMAKFHFVARGCTYREILMARIAIEPLMARLAAETRDKRAMALLQAALDEADSIDPNDEPEWWRVSDLFHSAIASISGNNVLNFLGQSLREIYRSRVRTSLMPPNIREHVKKVHSGIADAIFRGNGAVAEKLMRDHMLEFGKRSDKLHAQRLREKVSWSS
jgi:GntR family transcriptional repressor for pyruvate dehydrogenase complex